MTDRDERVWAIVQAYLAGGEAFDAAAARMAAIFHEWMHGDEPAIEGPRVYLDDPSLGGRPRWISVRPVPSVPDADQPRVSRLFARAFELLQASEEGAA
jgi:hypothetical protein